MSKYKFLSNEETWAIEAAIRSDDLEKLKELTEENTKPDAWSTFKREKALLLAVRCKRLEAVRYLLKLQGVNVNLRDKTFYNKTLLHRAVVWNDLAMVKLFLRHKADPNMVDDYKQYPLHTAVILKNEDVIELLLKSGADPNCTKCDYFLPLLDEFVVKSARVLLALVLNDADLSVAVRSDGRGVLFRAIEQGNIELIRHLLRVTGIDPNALDRSGMSPLLYLAAAGHLDVEKKIAAAGVLVEHGADVNFEDKMYSTPLSEAVKFGDKRFIEFLLDCGANINYEACYKSVIYGAHRHNDVEFIKYLVRKGAKLTLPVQVYMFQRAFDSFVRYEVNDSGSESAGRSWEVLRFWMKGMFYGTVTTYGDSTYKRVRKDELYEDEFRSMQNTKMCGDSSVTYRDFVMNEGNTLREGRARGVIESGECELMFPLMTSRLRYHLPKSMKRRKMLDDAATVLIEILDGKLPREIVEMIVASLDDEHLEVVLGGCKSECIFW